jgi:hypothetical protein
MQDLCSGYSTALIILVDAKIRLSSHVKYMGHIYDTWQHNGMIGEYLWVKDRKRYNLYFSQNKIKVLK